MSKQLTDLMDGTFESQSARITTLVEDNCLTPELGSLLLSYYAMGRNDAAGEHCDASVYAKEFNPKHDETMQKYRAARPAKLILV